MSSLPAALGRCLAPGRLARPPSGRHRGPEPARQPDRDRDRQRPRPAARRADRRQPLSGRRTTIVLLNALMGLPPVVVGLLVYLLLSRAGPLGAIGLLFTPAAMVIAQAILITPIIAALTRQVVEDAWLEYREQLRSLGETRLGAVITLLWDVRFSLVTIVLAGFGRAAAEVGAVIIVGGNIDGVTRVMTTAIALETSKGDLPLALGLGIILITIVVALNAAAYAGQGNRAAALRLTPMDMRAPMSLVAAAPGRRGVRGRRAPDHRRRLADARRRVAHGDPRTQRRGQERPAAPLPRAAAADVRVDPLDAAETCRRAAPAGDGVPAAGAAAPLGAGQRRAMRCGSPACRASRERARSRSAAQGRARAHCRPSGARALRRRAAAPRAGARVGAATGNPFSRRADREPRSRRDARSREGDRARCTRPARRS